jgi:hypothetical protein
MKFSDVQNQNHNEIKNKKQKHKKQMDVKKHENKKITKQTHEKYRWNQN